MNDAAPDAAKVADRRRLGQRRRSRTCCARSRSPTSRSRPARASAACTTASSTISATRGRSSCSASTRRRAVALAHGYARVTGRPLAVALHANVGLMHATMAIFNAWCDRIPMLLLGGVGPLDAMKRRPWVDWIHTSRDLGALVRGYTKWDDLPGIGAGRARSDPARVSHRDDAAAGARLRGARRRAAGRSADGAGAAARARSLPRRDCRATPPARDGARNRAAAREARRVRSS